MAIKPQVLVYGIKSSSMAYVYSPVSTTPKIRGQSLMFYLTRCVLVLSVTAWLLSLSVKSLKDNGHRSDISSLWAMGFGAIDETNLLHESRSLSFMGTVLLANLPQAILSFLYLLYNGLYTSMLLTDEWTRFAYQRKALRVTSPIGQQRSTYFLQLPYKYAIPLATVFGLMHWLVSQIIFPARITILDFTGAVNISSSVVTCGYSPIAIIFTIIFGSVLIIAVLLCGGFRRYRPRMPLGASCSMVISAACHPSPGDEDASLLPVMCGIVSQETMVLGTALSPARRFFLQPRVSCMLKQVPN